MVIKCKSNSSYLATMNSYTFQEHIHRYAVWTAARAVSRDFTGTENVEKAIDAVKLRDYFEGSDKPSDFDEWHKRKCRAIMAYLEPIVPKREASTKKTYKNGGNRVTYGRAAKIIAVYLKTAVILPEGPTGSRSNAIHPPIDAILLKNAAKVPGFKDLANEKWTQFDEDRYFKVLERLKTLSTGPLWQVEYFWKAGD